MIDVHCHLEQDDYSDDRDQVVENCRKELRAVITSCTQPRDFDLTISLVEKYEGFVFATAGIHPIYIKEITEKQKNEFLELVKENKGKILGIGEVGLDYNWVKESDWQEKQKQLFVEMIGFAKELRLPLVVHSREAHYECLKILEQEDAKEVLMHMFGKNNLTQRIIEDDYYVSTNTILLQSKNYKKVIRDMPIEKIMTETDSPWLGLERKRNDPLFVRIVAEKIAEIKKKSLTEVDQITTKNATDFFKLKPS
jgi:TatD DNase family protein